METHREEEYLETLFKMLEVQKKVTLTQLAGKMKLSTASVSGMVRKLQQNDLLKSEGKGGITLTKKGEKVAKRVIRRHRLTERLLTDVLGLKWDEVHEEACKLEHVISPQVENKLDKKLGNPKTCPHGYPIPTKEGEIKEEKLIPLVELKPKKKGVIVSVDEENPKMLHYLADLGLIPQVVVEVEEVAPFSGPLLVKVKGAKYALGPEVASKILVREKY